MDDADWRLRVLVEQVVVIAAELHGIRAALEVQSSTQLDRMEELLLTILTEENEMSDALQPIRDSQARMEAQLVVNATAIADLRALVASGTVTPEAIQAIVDQNDADIAALAATDAPPTP